jgi:hypothetical protein
MARPTTEKFVLDLMTHSRYGALAQLFVIEAISKWSEIIAEADAAKVDNGLICGQAWIAVAKEISAKIDAHMGSSVRAH